MSALETGYLPLALSSSSLFQESRSELLPAFLYGSAWKGERTADLVFQALEAGFMAIDTAAQPRHYREELVGEAVRQILRRGVLRREDIFLQTKFTPPEGQDLKGLPYGAGDPLAEQVRASVASSLHHLRAGDNLVDEEDYLDCVILHSPMETLWETLLVWRTLEEFVPKRIGHLGLSNVSFNNLELLYDLLDVKPAVVQNRFYGANGFDSRLRGFCRENGIVYQAFGALTKNPALLDSEPVKALAGVVGLETQMALYCLVLSLENMVVLNGTTDADRMKGDLSELDRIRYWISAAENQDFWNDVQTQFKKLIGDE
ncbi:MAG: hypothetical protein Q9163_001285 [Psora crenata]